MLPLFLLLLVIALSTPFSAQAGFIQLTPPDQTVLKNEIFPVEVGLDTEGQAIIGVDTVLKFDPTKLTVTEVIRIIPTLSLFPGFLHKIGHDSVLIASFAHQPPHYITGAGPVGIVYFRALKSGRAEIDVYCVPEISTDSNMSGPKGEDVFDYIDCEKSRSHFVTIEPSTTQPTSSQPHSCPTKIQSGDYNCDNKISLADFEEWRADYIAGNATIKEFEYFRAGFTRGSGDQTLK